jgi:hypothetical protein
MDQAVREMLEEADDPEHAAGDPRLDWPVIHARVAALRPELERIAGRVFVHDDHVQDASFFADVSVQRPGPQPHRIDTVFALRFSSFGWLFTTWSSCETERLPPEVVEKLVAAVSWAGFHYVPASALEEPYTGRHLGFAGSSWWNRFFDDV